MALALSGNSGYVFLSMFVACVHGCRKGTCSMMQSAFGRSPTASDATPHDIQGPVKDASDGSRNSGGSCPQLCSEARVDRTKMRRARRRRRQAKRRAGPTSGIGKNRPRQATEIKLIKPTSPSANHPTSNPTNPTNQPTRCHFKGHGTRPPKCSRGVRWIFVPVF